MMIDRAFNHAVESCTSGCQWCQPGSMMPYHAVAMRMTHLFNNHNDSSTPLHVFISAFIFNEFKDLAIPFSKSCITLCTIRNEFSRVSLVSSLHLWASILCPASVQLPQAQLSEDEETVIRCSRESQ